MPKNYPYGCSDEELRKTVQELAAQLINVDLTMNNILYYSPSVSDNPKSRKEVPSRIEK